MYKLIATPEQTAQLAAKLRAGNYGWGHAKQELFEVLEAQVAPMRERYVELRSDPVKLDAILDAGAEKARVIARRTMERVRAAIGIR
jgi:tryptophanyl-tRNA synthetase